MEFKELQEKVLAWADEKDLLHEENAYNKIKDRKGKTIDGCFVKEEDL